MSRLHFFTAFLLSNHMQHLDTAHLTHIYFKYQIGVTDCRVAPDTPVTRGKLGKKEVMWPISTSCGYMYHIPVRGSSNPELRCNFTPVHELVLLPSNIKLVLDNHTASSSIWQKFTSPTADQNPLLASSNFKSPNLVNPIKMIKPKQSLFQAQLEALETNGGFPKS